VIEWVEVEPVRGARTWVLCENGEPIDGDRVDDGDFDD
jgi:hypothetical protein